VAIFILLSIIPEQINWLLKTTTFYTESLLTFITSLFDCFIPWLKITRIHILIVLILLVMSLPVYLFSRAMMLRKSKKTVPAVDKKEEDVFEEQDYVETNDALDFSKGMDYNREVVVKFFLKIYKLQLGAMKTAPAKYRFIDTINVWPNRVYELSVMADDEWVSRRLTIGPIGDDGVSKSVCFFVIYDDHLVVKIPSDPIETFEEYLSLIEADMVVAKRLSPKVCIIPKVSVIIGRLFLDSDTSGEYSQKKEKEYIERLHTNVQLQEYLKIGNTFVFFMDLSKFYFLSNVVKEMHDMDNLLPSEILNHPDIIWDEHAFEGRYGKNYSHVGYEMRNIYDEYEREISRLLIQYGVASALPTYNMKTWFLIHLSGRGKIEPDGNFSEGFIEDLNSLSRESMIDNRMSIESYRSAAREYISKRAIAKHKPEISSLITSIIALLIWLGKKRIALRDLKPDNLLIAGDPAQYPQFLRKVDQYSIGFIDLETAVDYRSDDIEAIKQPQLGGTPKYATPGHLFPNELIIGVFGDLKKNLHLQDWHASVAMIFRIITGGTLFEKTATLLPEIKRILESPVNDSEQLLSMTEYVSRLFWKSAFDEFNEKIIKNRNILDVVTTIILEKDKVVILKEMLKERKSLAKVLLSTINSQTFFKSKSNREKIYNASVRQISAMREKCKKGIANPDDLIAVLKFFREIEFLKTELDQRQIRLDYLKSAQTEIPVATIMEIMFNIVFTAMYTAVWGSISDEDEETIETTSNASYDATI